MGTRGLYGFRKNGVDKTTYNHFDSYPDYLGKIMVEFCQKTYIEEMNEIFDRIVLVKEGSKPTQKQISDCIEYYDGSVSNQTPEDWYCLLRDAQGNPNVYKHGLKYMIDNQSFIKDSLFCEYAYIINLDTNCLEFWVGFQKEPDEENRYGTEKEDGYYPCKLVEKFSFSDMDTQDIEDIVKDMNKAADQEYNDDTDDANKDEEKDVTSTDLSDIAYAIENGFTSGTLDNGIEWNLEFNM